MSVIDTIEFKGTAYAKIVSGGAKAYRRDKDLPRILCVPERIVANMTTHQIVECLSGLVRSTTNKGKEGHWSYNINHHLAESAETTALRAELEAQEAELAVLGDKTHRDYLSIQTGAA